MSISSRKRKSSLLIALFSLTLIPAIPFEAKAEEVCYEWRAKAMGDGACAVGGRDCIVIYCWEVPEQ
jgi:hypothetical protein